MTIRKMVFSAIAALLLVAGALLTTATQGKADPGFASSALAASSAIHADSNLIQVKSCGPWNNWCGSGNKCGPWNDWCGNGSKCGKWNNWCGQGNGGGGGGGCIDFGGVHFCVGGGGSNCHWVNGVHYCSDDHSDHNNDCIWWNHDKYCNYKHHGDCIISHGDRYCTGDN